MFGDFGFCLAVGSKYLSNQMFCLGMIRNGWNQASSEDEANLQKVGIWKVLSNTKYLFWTGLCHLVPLSHAEGWCSKQTCEAIDSCFVSHLYLCVNRLEAKTIIKMTMMTSKSDPPNSNNALSGISCHCQCEKLGIYFI